MNIPDNFSESFEKVLGLKILKFFDADLDPESFWPWIRDPGWKNSVPGSATLATGTVSIFTDRMAEW
jgi:hypothetical protein